MHTILWPCKFISRYVYDVFALTAFEVIVFAWHQRIMSIRFSLNTIPTLLTYVCSPFCHINNVFVYNLFTALRFSFCYSVCKDSESRAECKEKVIIFFYCRDASYFRWSQSCIIFLIVQRYRGKTLAIGSCPEGQWKCSKAKWLYLKRLLYRCACVLNSPGNSWNSLNSLCFIK